MAQEQVILDIKVDSAEAVTNIDRAQKALALLKDEQDKLDESYSKGTITYEEYMKATADCTEQIIAQKNAIKANNDVLKQNVKELTAADGSLSQMRAKLKQMTTAYDNMSKAEREANDKGGALLQQIQDQTRAIQEAEYSTGRFQRNVGNYPKVFDTKALGDNLEAQQAQKDAIKANNDVIKELERDQTLMLAKDPYDVFYFIPKMSAVGALDFRFVHELQHLMRMLQIDKEVEL